MVRLVSIVTALLGATALSIPMPAPVHEGRDVSATLAERCVPDDPTSCGAGSVKRASEPELETPAKRCIPDDPTSCDPGDFGSGGSSSKRDVVEEKRCVPDDPTSCGSGSA